MSDGIGCKCAASSAVDCSCDVDWTPAELVRFREEIERLQAENATFRASHRACDRCDAADAAEIEMLRAENKRLRGDHIACHMGRDILASLYDAWNNLPACGMLGIVCGAIQEIQSMRPDEVSK